ncbi:MAG: PAS domain S-box protein [Armatimonadota bacterium]
MHAERKALLLAWVLGAVIWLGDARAHYYAGPRGPAAVWAALLPPMGGTLLMRIATFALIVSFGVLTMSALRHRRLSQAALRESTWRYERVFQHAPDAMWELDASGNILHGNLALATLCGLPLSELAGRRCHELLPSPLCHTAGCPLRCLASGEAFETQEVLLERPDGSRVLCLTAASPLSDVTGAFVGLVADFRDISRRRRTQAQLQRLNSQYRLLVESQVVETFIAQHGVIVFASGTAHTRMGYDPGELLGKRAIEFVCPERREALLQWEWRHRAGESVPDAFETQLVTKSGALRWVEVWTQAIEDYEGAPAIIGHMVDITEARELRGQLEHSQRLEALGTLAGGVAHEFNNVLQAILLNASLLQISRALTEAEGDKLKTIIERTEYGARLTDQLLTFSRRTPVEYGPLNLPELLEESKRLLDRTVPRQIRIRSENQPGLWTIQGDGGRLKQVFINLALNARDAMPTGGQLVFQTLNVMLTGAELKSLPKLEPGPHVLVKIQDTGTGMAPQTLSRVFEPFYTTKGVGQGTGLGLSIVHGIIDTHGGVIRIRSRLGEGTTFHLYLPAYPDMTPQSVVEPVVTAPRGASERVLLVDDEPEVIRGASEALLRFGYQVSSVPSGAEAVALVRQQPTAFDLVILDLVMPGLSGQETFARLRELSPRLKVLIASGYMPQMERDSLLAGANGHLDKPFSLDRLLETVRMVLDQPNAG